MKLARPSAPGPWRALAFDGAAWLALWVLSAAALFDRMQPPWLLAVLWLSLHPVALALYLGSSWSSRYRRYVWALRSWITVTTYVWIYQSFFFVAHVVAEGFYADMGPQDSAAAAVGASACLYVWCDAAWCEAVRPFHFVKFGSVIAARAEAAKSGEPEKRGKERE
jgi:hypothetical protein